MTKAKSKGKSNPGLAALKKINALRKAGMSQKAAAAKVKKAKTK